MRTRTQVAVVLCLALAMLPMISRTSEAQQVVISGSGSGVLETPPVSNGAVAFAQCTLDRTAQTIACSSRVYNLVDLIAAHLHVTGPGAAGPVVIPIPNLPLRISGAWGQSWTWTAADVIAGAALGINSMEDVMNACAAGNCYLNWHTTASPGGSVRVNLCPQSRASNTINSIAICSSVQAGELLGAPK